MSEEFVNPYDAPEYQSFVESMVQYCKCEYDQPCDGVLAGGICERKSNRDFEGYDAEEFDYLPEIQPNTQPPSQNAKG